MTVYLNADKTAFVKEGSAEAAFGVAESDIDRLELREKFEAFMSPPEVKQAKRPADKMIRAHNDK